MPRPLAACIAILLLAASCATAPKPAASRGVFVLLPDDQGKTGAILVSGSGGERLLTEPGQSVEVRSGTPPGEPHILPERQVRTLVGPALEALPKPPVQFILYFRHDAAELTEESRARLKDILRTIRERAPVDISVVGHTDTLGDRRYNYQLSFKRAQAVATLLTRDGVDPSVIEIASHGKDNPLIPTGDQVSEPRNRRVEVTVR